MIAVDTSALVAIVLRETLAARCVLALETADRVLISAGTLVEVGIVSARLNVQADTQRFLGELEPRVIDVDADTASRIERIYCMWGKTFHKASLNFGDCFAYDVARQHGCPLLYIGNDFAQTDIASALQPS